MPTQASQLYGTNLVNLMKLMTPGKDGKLVLDFDDVVQRSIAWCLRRRPGRADLAAAAVQVSAAPARPGNAGGGAGVAGQAADHPGRRFAVVGVAAALFFLLAALSPPALLGT